MMEFQRLNFLPSDWVNALCAALFHSLWVGVIMALMAGVAVVATKNSKPSLRYNLLTTLLATFSFTVIFIFYQSLNKVNLFSAYLNRSFSDQNQFFDFNFMNDIEGEITLLGTYNNQLMLVWFGVIFIKTIGLVLGLKGVHHLKRAKVFNAGVYWQNKVNELAQHLYIKQSVQILQSGIAKIPMVIGHFKPIILMPIGMLNHLSLSEVEAILSHELAHIKRRDYLVNILQNILEVLFFFNPAVLWISKMIREERENCCDDLAISCTNDKNGYLKALVSCQEFNLNSTGFAMSMANGKGQLISRIRRIAFNKRASLGSVEKTILSVALFAILGLSMAFTFNEKPARIVKVISKKVQTEINADVSTVITTSTKSVRVAKQTTASAIVPIKETTDTPEKALVIAAPEHKNVNAPKQIETCAKIEPVKSVEFYVPPVSRNISTTISTTTTTVRIDGKVVVYVSHQGKDAREDIKRDMLNDSIIVIGENPTYILNRDEMLVNGVKQDNCTHQKYKEKYITRPDTQYRIGT